jgi:uncharacterized membrane protein (UPF0182 family)
MRRGEEARSAVLAEIPQALRSGFRFVFRRRLEERLQALAPFILWDKDPL